ncbi:hypothetical protein JG687_00013986, partial [Phytophthora cactorum]
TCNIQGVFGGSHSAAPGAEHSSTARRRPPRFPSRSGVPGGLSASASVVANSPPPPPRSPNPLATSAYRLSTHRVFFVFSDHLYCFLGILSAHSSHRRRLSSSLLSFAPCHVSYAIFFAAPPHGQHPLDCWPVALVEDRCTRLSPAVLAASYLQVNRHNVGVRRGVIVSTRSLPAEV